MTNLLIRAFIKNYENVKNPNVREAYGRLSGLVGIIANVFLFVFKLIAGWISGSISIKADAVNNLSDAASSVVSLIGFKLSGKHADTEHPYGHARYEYLSGLFVAVIILVIGVETLKGSITKIINPEKVELNVISVVILLSSVTVKLWLSFFNKSLNKKVNSKTLEATAADSRNDVASTLAVLAAMIIGKFTKLQLDGVMGLCVAIFIIYSGIELIRETINPLLGQAPDPELVKYVREKILTYPGVLGTHDLMVHDYGPGRLFASVHVEMAAEADVLESHDVIDNIERDFLKEIKLHMIVHLDPIVTSNSCVNDFRYWLSENIKKIDKNLSVHDVRMVQGTTHTNVIFDCVAPPGKEHKELKEKITALVQDEYPSYFCVITIDSDFAPISADEA